MDRSGIVPGPVRYIGIGAVPFYKTVQKSFDRSAWRICATKFSKVILDDVFVTLNISTFTSVRRIYVWNPSH